MGGWSCLVSVYVLVGLRGARGRCGSLPQGEGFGLLALARARMRVPLPVLLP